MISQTALKKRSVNIAGHSTSITLEHAFWEALKRIAALRNTSIAALIADIDQAREMDPGGPNLSSAIRVFVLTATKTN